MFPRKKHLPAPPCSQKHAKLCEGASTLRVPLNLENGHFCRLATGVVNHRYQSGDGHCGQRRYRHATTYWVPDSIDHGQQRRTTCGTHSTAGIARGHLRWKPECRTQPYRTQQSQQCIDVRDSIVEIISCTNGVFAVGQSRRNMSYLVQLLLQPRILGT